MFPLALIEGERSVQITEQLIRKNRERSERLARKLSDKQLVKRAANIKSRAGCRRAVTELYEKNVYVAELARRKANGFCQLCEQPAPFRDRHGRPFLETHHIRWISEGGEDTIENTVALCPNCHARMHALNLKSDRRKLRKKAETNVFQYTLFDEVIFG
jgi:5-methylcytosine-specific restriction protein A